jgi:tetratricopeptide (TPR) repeat protein
MGGAARRQRQRPGSPGLLALAFVGLLAAPAWGDPGSVALARADAAWERRADGCDDAGRARGALAAAAVDAYQEAVDADPSALRARWKLVRALYFAADFVAGDPSDPVRLLERATRESDEALDLLAARLGVSGRLDSFTPARLQTLPPEEAADAAGAFFWSAVAWGGWSQYQGMIEAVRAGVADRLYHAARAVIALDPSFEEGGAHRLLARVHAQVPRIPFFSGWVDPELAVPAAERAVALAPNHPGNRFLLALTILDVAPERRAEAVRLLEETARSEPRPDQRAEDLATRKAARERLAREIGEARFAGDVAAGGRSR